MLLFVCVHKCAPFVCFYVDLPKVTTFNSEKLNQCGNAFNLNDTLYLALYEFTGFKNKSDCIYSPSSHIFQIRFIFLVSIQVSSLHFLNNGLI